MSLTTRSPIRMAGANLNSGGVNTGEVQYTRGGVKSLSIYSGGLITGGSGSIPGLTVSGGHVKLVNGAGRLNYIFPHQAVSGVAAFFYDSAVLAQSGTATIPNSGMTIIAVLPATTFAPGNSSGGQNGPIGPIMFEMPFQSGLCVSNPSGAAGWTISYTTEIQSGGLGQTAGG